MGLFKNENEVKIKEEDLRDSKLSGINFKEDLVKKRAFIDVLGARLAMKYLFSRKMEASNIYSMYTLQKVLEKFDIADIYLNNIKIDVRLVFSPDEIFIPKSQFKYEITPDIYMVLCLNENLSSADFIGFFEPDDIDKSNCNADLYFVTQESLKQPDELKSFVKNFVKTEKTLDENDKTRAKELFLNLIDGEISTQDEKFLIKALSSSTDLREEFVELENFEELSQKAGLAIKEEDKFLDVIGAQEVTEDIPEGLEEVQINLSEDDIKPVEDEKSEELIEDKEQTKEEKEGLSVGEKAAIAGGTIAAAGAIAAIAGENSANAAEISATGAKAGVDIATSATKGLADISSKTISAGADIVSNIANSDKTDFDSLISNDLNEDLPDFSPEIEGSETETFSNSENLENSTKNSEDNFQNDEDTDFENIEKFTDNVDESMPEISFSDELFKETEETDLKNTENDEKSNEEEIAPVEQIKENPEAMEALQDKIKEAQLASMPNYFNNIEAEDSVENKEEDNDGEAENSINGNDFTDTSAENLQQETEINDIEYTNTENFDDKTNDIESLPELKSEDLGKEEEKDLMDLDSFSPLPELGDEKAILQEQEEEEKEDVVNIDNFDFEMFDKEIDKEVEPKEENTELEEEDFAEADLPKEAEPKIETPKESDSKIHLLSDDGEPIIDATEETDEDIATKGASADNFENIDENDEEVTNDDIDLNDITSQVDSFLNDIQLNDTQKSILADQIDIDEDILKDNNEILPPEGNNLSNPSEVPQEDTTKNEFSPQTLLADEFNAESSDKTEQNIPQGDETLEVLFKDNNQTDDDLPLNDEIPGKKLSSKPNKSKKMIISAIAGAMIVSIAITAVVHNTITPQNTTFPSTMNAQSGANGENPLGNTTESSSQESNNIQNGIAPNQANSQNPNMPNGINGTMPNATGTTQDMNKAISNTFTTQAITAQVSKIAWEVPEDLSYNAGFRRYLQASGKSLKLSLQNDLLLATEMAYSTKCVVDVVISNSGAVQSTGIISSSGSKQIDGIVLQSVKETLNYLKPSSSDLNGHSADLTLIINF